MAHHTNHTRTILQLVAEQSEETRVPHSLPEGLGLLRLSLHRLEAELALPGEEQDAEILLEHLVSLAAVAVTVGDALVLPEIPKELGEKEVS